MNIDFTPITNALEPAWRLLKQLFAEHHFLTIVCGFFVIMMTISCYRFLKSINPALVLLILMVVLFILVMHWTYTRTEPNFMAPIIDFLSNYVPQSPYLPKK
jgi:Flp pilus assembly protein TadB